MHIKDITIDSLPLRYSTKTAVKRFVKRSLVVSVVVLLSSTFFYGVTVVPNTEAYFAATHFNEIRKVVTTMHSIRQEEGTSGLDLYLNSVYAVEDLTTGNVVTDNTGGSKK